MNLPPRRALAFVLTFVSVVLFVLFIDIGLLPVEDCSPHDALLVAGRPSYRGAWGLWACGGQTSIVLGVIAPLCLLGLALLVVLWPKR